MSAGAGGNFSSLELTLGARAENIPVARQAVAALLSGKTEQELVGDVKTALTEACMNAVVHAYPGGEGGEFQVKAVREGGRLRLDVRDWGVGIQPRPLASSPGLRIGLPLIAALADEFEARSGPRKGTWVTMSFDLERAGEPEGTPEPAPRHAEDETILGVRSDDGVAPSVASTLAMVAARSDLSVDGVSDVQVLGDLLGSVISRDPDERVRLAVRERENGLSIRVGPLPQGGAERLVARGALPALGNVFERLADRWQVETEGEEESLLIEFGAPESD